MAAIIARDADIHSPAKARRVSVEIQGLWVEGLPTNSKWVASGEKPVLQNPATDGTNKLSCTNHEIPVLCLSTYSCLGEQRRDIAAYVIVDVEITDASLYGKFMEQVTATVESHGGKFVARGGKLEIVLGDWAPKRVAILQFDNLDQVHSWLQSPKYTALDDMRSRSSNIDMVVVEGL